MTTVVKELGEVRGPLLVFGGPYSNLQATQALFAKADELDIPLSNIICTGDVVAYCGDPGATTDLIHASGIHVIKGNVELSLSAGAQDCGCGFEEGSACDLLSVQWFNQAVKEVSTQQLDWKAALPDFIQFTYAGHRFEIVHGTRREVSRFVFASDDHSALFSDMAQRSIDVTLSGHNGIPYTRGNSDHLWHNAGVIGMPANEGETHTWYSVIEERASGEIEFRHERLTFDQAAAAKNMREKGYPEAYATALETGLWPSLDILPETEKAMTGKSLQSQLQPQLLQAHQRKAA